MSFEKTSGKRNREKVTDSIGPGDPATYGDVHVARIIGASGERRTEDAVAMEMGQAYWVARNAGRTVLQPVLIWPQGKMGEVHTGGDKLPKGNIPGVPPSGYLVISEAPDAFPGPLQPAQGVLSGEGESVYIAAGLE